MHCSVTRTHAELVVVLNIVGHVSKGLAKVGKAIVHRTPANHIFQKVLYQKPYFS